MDFDVYGKIGDVRAGMVARHAHVVKYNPLRCTCTVCGISTLAVPSTSKHVEFDSEILREDRNNPSKLFKNTGPKILIIRG